MSLPRRTRQLIDRDLAKAPVRQGSLTIGLGALIAVPPLVLLPGPWSLIVAGLLVGGWFLFAGWRVYRMLRASSLRGDRDYDRNLRPLLSKEYQNTESATKTAGRKARDRT